MTIIHQIDHFRAMKAISKRELCITADITPEYYSKLINDKSQPSLVIIEKLAKAVDCEIILVYNPF